MANLTTLGSDIVEAILEDALPDHLTLFDIVVDPPALREGAAGPSFRCQSCLKRDVIIRLETPATLFADATLSNSVGSERVLKVRPTGESAFLFVSAPLACDAVRTTGSNETPALTLTLTCVVRAKAFQPSDKLDGVFGP